MRNNQHFILDEKRKVEIGMLLRDLIEEKRCFIQPRFNLNQLSKDTKISTNLLSAFFNQGLGHRFTDYINDLRITHCKQLIEDGAAVEYSLKGLSKKCGFNNRNSFTTAFKKITGMLPSSYIKLSLDNKNVNKRFLEVI